MLILEAFQNTNNIEITGDGEEAIPLGGMLGVASPSPRLVAMDVKAPMALLRVGKCADSFRRLRQMVIQEAGFDFLGVLGDMMRSRNFRSNKDGVANRSRHKCGDAFDINQDDKRMVVVAEPQATQSFFRIWLHCEAQDGSQGKQVELRDVRGVTVKGWFVDFTALADRCGWKRIPAWNGWSVRGRGYIRMEFWHYQQTEGLGFNEAMEFLYSSQVPTRAVIDDVRKPSFKRVIGLNDRGLAVQNIQDKLAALGLLPRNESDGVFGAKTQLAVKALQERYKLDVDGLVGEQTRQLLDSLVNR